MFTNYIADLAVMRVLLLPTMEEIQLSISHLSTRPYGRLDRWTELQRHERESKLSTKFASNIHILQFIHIIPVLLVYSVEYSFS